MTPTAAPSHWPYQHRTVEEVDGIQRGTAEQIAMLDWINRMRALTPLETRKLDKLIKGSKRAYRTTKRMGMK